MSRYPMPKELPAKMLAAISELPLNTDFGESSLPGVRQADARICLQYLLDGRLIRARNALVSNGNDPGICHVTDPVVTAFGANVLVGQANWPSR